jgi:hypothetical protein
MILHHLGPIFEINFRRLTGLLEHVSNYSPRKLGCEFILTVIPTISPFPVTSSCLCYL